MRIERRHASRGSAIYLPRLSMLMFPNWGQTARVTRIQLTTPPSNSSVKLSSPLLNLCLPSTARAYRFSRVGVFPHPLAFSLSPLPILLLLFFDRKKLDFSVNKNKTDIYFASEEESSSSKIAKRLPRIEKTRDILLVMIFATVVGELDPGFTSHHLHLHRNCYTRGSLVSRIFEIRNVC